MDALRRRVAAAVLLAATVALGLAVHYALPDGEFGDIVGAGLYTVAVYLGVVLLAPRARASTAFALAVAWSFAVELLQLTELPARANEAFAPARLVLGSGFEVRDLLVYALGGGLMLGADLAVTRIRARRRHAPLVP
ncbi:DUF2809 domain-containing protein [Pseudoclavibacter sp. RFBJ3]|nr:DUF2809 domain-containing protein [Pseudoclavibacter sp. RFBJ5]PPF91799.1 DUF2809 domain-containing protein [Pseudoclavibacter sp. RFBJ3]PPF96733.1 DUF2809 domain-containing protein [Pseudoclavibacter sp. RFBH5]PPG19677.1 DUF2809 domain-containing protein [Pseudoclavibacter sp. RFBI4]